MARRTGGDSRAFLPTFTFKKKKTKTKKTANIPKHDAINSYNHDVILKWLIMCTHYNYPSELAQAVQITDAQDFF